MVGRNFAAPVITGPKTEQKTLPSILWANIVPTSLDAITIFWYSLSVVSS